MGDKKPKDKEKKKKKADKKEIAQSSVLPIGKVKKTY